MKPSSMAVAGVIAIIGSVSVAAAAQRVEARSDQVNGFGLLIGGPEFMATFGGIPTAALRRSETSDRTIRLTFEQEWPDRRLAVGVSVVRFGPIPANYLPTYLAEGEAIRERMFRDEANEACAGPVSITRRVRPPAMAADGATPIRLEAVCRTPRDARWSAIFFVSEQLVNRGVQCGWTLRWESRSAEAPSGHPVQDVCVPMQGAQRGGNISVSVVAPSGE